MPIGSGNFPLYFMGDVQTVPQTSETRFNFCLGFCNKEPYIHVKKIELEKEKV
jgi:hypothetical protein